MLKTSLSPTAVDDILARAVEADDPASAYRMGRQPVHSVYGGAHIFNAGTFEKLARLARRSFETYARDAREFAEVFSITPHVAEKVYARVKRKLADEAIEDFRIDFEDGYGVRSADEEDAQAASAAGEMAKAMSAGTLPPFIGIRIRPLSGGTVNRAIRTLDLFATALSEAAGRLPENFVVTLPKVSSPDETAAVADVLDRLEGSLGIARNTIGIEVMVETARSVVGPDGRFALGAITEAARGRCRAAHFGAYDYTAEFGITADDRLLRHSVCDIARHLMQLSLAGTGIALADGVTNVMPIPVHRGENLTDVQLAKNRSTVHSAWRLHYDNVRHALRCGFFQGWDLHPAQFVARYAAVYTFFLEALEDAATRLRAFIDQGARSTMAGNIFDDAASGQGLLNLFLRAIDCGCLTEAEAEVRTGISPADLRSRSFTQILKK